MASLWLSEYRRKKRQRSPPIGEKEARYAELREIGRMDWVASTVPALHPNTAGKNKKYMKMRMRREEVLSLEKDRDLYKRAKTRINRVTKQEREPLKASRSTITPKLSEIK